ncbi:MAG: hypothetical protein LBG59_06440 [Candidatus Peribacteria bacterium]|nr:hypothetical protein [Candidatus Peribacteria bacterium]
MSVLMATTLQATMIKPAIQQNTTLLMNNVVLTISITQTKKKLLIVLYVNSILAQ